MNDLDLMIDLHLDGTRQGPGSDDTTRLAMTLAGVRDRRDLRIADIGCGTGASTIVLARELDARVTAVDLVPAFLHRLDEASRRHGVGDRIVTRNESMDALSFPTGSLDVIWSEGAIYSIGFEHGVRSWRTLLAPGGILAVSELTWLTHERPAEIDEHWSREYPEVGTASAKIAVLEANGYTPIGYFPLPQRCWLDEYYRPLQERFGAFLDRHDHRAAARSLVASEQREVDLYERYADYVGYGFYIARRTSD